MIVIPDIAERTNLDLYLDGLTPYYHLFINDVTPDSGSLVTLFEEADWPTYAAKRVTSWAPALTVAGRAVSTADQQLWTRGPIGTPRMVYGYYVTNGIDGPLLWCERRNNGPIPMGSPTDAVLILPRITLAQCDESPYGVLGGGDLVGTGEGTPDAVPAEGGGDLVGEGEGIPSGVPAEGGGDLVGEGEGIPSGVPAEGGGDLVGEGEGE